MKFYGKILTSLSLLITVGLVWFGKYQRSSVGSSMTSKVNSYPTLSVESRIGSNSGQPLKNNFTNKVKPLKNNFKNKAQPLINNITDKHQPLKNNITDKHQPLKKNITDKHQPLKNNFINNHNRLKEKTKQKCEHASAMEITKHYSGFSIKTNIIDIPFKILPVDICGTRISNDPYVVIMITSIPGHTAMRNTIRETWASFNNAGNISVEDELNNKTIGLVFVLGKFNNSDNISMGAALRESRVYGDILQVDIEESHENLVYKVLAGLRWMADNCKGSKYLLKVDEDVYVHLPRLVPILQLHDEKDVIMGFSHPFAHPANIPMRYGRYKLTFEQYKFCRFLTYAEGNTYVISAGLVPKLCHLSKYIPPNKVEDYYFTGILRSVAGAPLIHDRSFSKAIRSIDRRKIILFYKYRRISETRCSGKDMKTLWHLYRNYYLRRKQHARLEQRKRNRKSPVMAL